MSRRHRSAPLVVLALGSLLLAGCGTGGPPSRGDATNSIRDDLVAAGEDRDVASAIADCMTDGLWDSGDFTTDERDEVIQATDGDEPDPDLAARVQALYDSCVDDAGTGESQSSGEEDEVTTTTEG